MKQIAIVGLVLIGVVASAQTSLNNGVWSSGGTWSGGVPTFTSGTCTTGDPTTAGAGAGCTVTPVSVGTSVQIDQNISITTGVFYFGSGAAPGNALTNSTPTDVAGGAAYTVTIDNPGGFNATAAILDIRSGTTTFEGALTIDDGSLYVRAGATLVTGTFNISGGAKIQIDGTLIVNGNMINNGNGSGTFGIAGLVSITGFYDAPVGNVVLTGLGDIVTGGSLTTNGGSTIFGSTNNCNTGPCSGQNLCFGHNGGGAQNNVITPATQNACALDVVTILDGDDITSVLSYEWYSSTTSATAGFTAISPAVTTPDYDPDNLVSVTTWYKRKATISGCSGISTAVVINVTANGTWLGGNTDWENENNWCIMSGVTRIKPATTTDLIIPTLPRDGNTNFPIVNTATVALARNLTVNTNATVTINSTRNLEIYGNIVNNGTITTNGTLTFKSPSAAQTVTGSGVATYAGLTFNNTSGLVPAVTFASNVAATSTLTMSAGVVNLGGFTLTLGTSTGAPGTLTYSAGRFYNGTFSRWFTASALTLGSGTTGLFPVGSSVDYRPMNVGYTSALTFGGTISASHTAPGTPDVISNITDDLPVVIRTSSSWTVGTGNGISGGSNSFSLRGEGTGFGTIEDVADLRLTLSSSVVGLPGINSGDDSSPGPSNPRVGRTNLFLADIANTFYIGSVDGVNTTLPITLSDFDASLSKEGVNLSWITLTEENSDFFQVEKATNGYDFTSIGKMSAQGNSFTRINYSFLDQNTNFSRAFYRLKNVDIGGAFTYSNVVSVEKTGFNNAGVLVYPNPAENRRLNVLVGDGSPVEGIISLCDLSGKSVSSEMRNNIQGEYQISENIQSGFYLLKVQTINIRQIVKVIIR